MSGIALEKHSKRHNYNIYGIASEALESVYVAAFEKRRPW